MYVYLVLDLHPYMHTYAMFILIFMYRIFTYIAYVHIPFCSTSLIFCIYLDETISFYIIMFSVSLVVKVLSSHICSKKHTEGKCLMC